jgi:hypothetical protein
MNNSFLILMLLLYNVSPSVRCQEEKELEVNDKPINLLTPKFIKVRTY